MIQKIKKYLFKSKSFKSFYYNATGLQSILKPIRAYYYNSKDFSYLQYEIMGKVRDSNLKISPMFGTLLSLHRSGTVINADDFDFCLEFLDFNKVELVEHFENQGMEFISLSLVGVEKKLVEISFSYKGARVDFFDIAVNRNNSREIGTHICPNFRLGDKEIVIKDDLTYINYVSYFQVSYDNFNIIINNKYKMFWLKDPVSFFVNHYGDDWMVAKDKDFIDYSKYQFIEEVSSVISGPSRKLKEIINL